jgi:5-formyltetrahydrofolate cyclo-ligase
MVTVIDKTEFRKMMKRRRDELSDEYIVEASRIIEGRVLALDAYKRARSIFVYVSTGKEPSTKGIIKQALSDGKELYIPKCISKTEMIAVRITGIDDLVPGRLGIPEPAAITETKTANELDLIIVPCIAASHDGKRLGHGAGYYDRFLESSSANAICLCFGEMIDPDIPVTEHDVIIPDTISD